MPRRMIVGLGNPGPQYELTPHNLGFLVVDRLAERHNIRLTRPEANSLVGSGTVAGTAVVLVKPQTYMNVSGPAVKLLLAKYELAPQDLVLVFDELDLPWTGLRIRKSGSAGTHNGVRSVVNSLGQSDFTRVRLGIQPAHPVRNVADYVLAPFPRGQYEALDELLDWSSTAVESILAEGVEKAMTRFNRRAHGLTNEEA